MSRTPTRAALAPLGRVLFTAGACPLTPRRPSPRRATASAGGRRSSTLLGAAVLGSPEQVVKIEAIAAVVRAHTPGRLLYTVNIDDNTISIKPAPAPRLVRLDHLVLTVVSIEETVRFYTSVLGMTEVVFGEGRHALAFGEQKLNLHRAGREFEPKAARPTPGSADLCFVADADPTTIAAWLRTRGVSVEEGPVTRTGARGRITSFYFRDPDGNLVELATYMSDAP
jgi:catechol 2,3-dioxygenase-like lactoylglutathione lyase family enzyme